MEPSGVVVFFHAHPDDEAIFTGATMAMLQRRGWRVALVVATGGELGVGDDRATLGEQRQNETRHSCNELGIDAPIFLTWEDSGLDGENPNGFAHVDAQLATDSLVDALRPLGKIAALVGYDDTGIYGHPDHVQVTTVARMTARALGIATTYEATVDREYLHFVETHVVVDAGLGERPIGRGLAASNLGMPSVLIDTAVDATEALEAKRSAMAAHASQLPADAPAFALGQENFAAVYGFEWYLRDGPPGPIETLPLV